MSHEPSLKEIQKEWHGSYKAYANGFFGSLLLTLFSFGAVIFEVAKGKTLLIIVVLLALAQAYVQLRYFLHVGEEPKPRWETLAFYFMLVILFIIAAGSLWIMFDLNDRMMMDM